MRDPKHHASYAKLYAQLEALPENMVGEIIDGELSVMGRPRRRHVQAGARLDRLLDRLLLGGGGGKRPSAWVILPEVELHLGSDVLVPDLSGWRAERLPSGEGDEPAWFTTVPDWVCEVLSPSTSTLDRMRKLPKYARAGVGFAWLVDPLGQSLEVFRAEHEHMLQLQTFEGGEKVRAKPFEELELDLSALWAP